MASEAANNPQASSRCDRPYIFAISHAVAIDQERSLGFPGVYKRFQVWSGQHRAIHPDDLAGHVAGHVTCQEERDAGYFFRGAYASHFDGCQAFSKFFLD